MAITPTLEARYAALGPKFAASTIPTSVAAPKILCANHAVARQIGIDPDWLDLAEAAEVLGGNMVPVGWKPVAMAYAGHQFAGWNPNLGDGRAILLGESTGPDGIVYDIHLKGSGRTPFSRNGDGRATLGSVLREYVMSEAMAALRVPTTRSLAVVATGESVLREQPMPGAVLARVATSHVRVGTFQLFASRGDVEAIRALADHVIARNYPELEGADDRYTGLLDAAARRQAKLIAQWMGLGFIHGVMNTDNASIAGETIDFGPCAMMDAFHPGKVFSSIDQNGRYAWNQQGEIGLWNMTRLAETLLPLIDADEARAIDKAQAVLGSYVATFSQCFLDNMRAKLGLLSPLDDDNGFVGETIGRMTEGRVDFTLFFRRLTQIAAGASSHGLVALFNEPATAQAWLTSWRARLDRDATEDMGQRASKMAAANPIIIPRNHRVEEAIAAASKGDLAPFHQLCDAVRTPFEDRPEFADFELPPRTEQIVHQTFCGT